MDTALNDAISASVGGMVSAFFSVLPLLLGLLALKVFVKKLVPMLGSLGSMLPAAETFADVKAKPLMNKKEQQIYKTLEAAVAQHLGKTFRVFPQVSYGEFLKARDQKSFNAFNSKRADFVVSRTNGAVAMVIEYHGAGHWGYSSNQQRNARRRDAVKAAVTRSAGLRYVVLGADADEYDIDAEIGAFALSLEASAAPKTRYRSYEPSGTPSAYRPRRRFT